jgi:hypothetical protein
MSNHLVNKALLRPIEPEVPLTNLLAARLVAALQHRDSAFALSEPNFVRREVTGRTTLA